MSMSNVYEIDFQAPRYNLHQFLHKFVEIFQFYIVKRVVGFCTSMIIKNALGSL